MKCRVYDALKPPCSSYDALYFDVCTKKDAIKLTMYLWKITGKENWVWSEIKKGD